MLVFSGIKCGSCSRRLFVYQSPGGAAESKVRCVLVSCGDDLLQIVCLLICSIVLKLHLPQVFILT